MNTISKALITVLFLLIGTFQSETYGATHFVYIRDGLKNAESKEFIAHIKSSIWEADIEEINTVSAIRKQPPDSAVLLVIGPSAFHEALEAQTGVPIVSLFISRRQYLELKSKHRDKQVYTTAIFADADINDQISLVTGIYNRAIKIGVLISQSTEHFKDEIERVSTAAESDKTIDINYAKIKTHKDLYLAINRFKHLGIEVILALPDSEIYNTQSIRAIILSSHRNNQSIIGFSDRVVAAGALASVYYLPKHIAAESISLITTYFSNGYLGDERFARNFNVAVNRTIAKSLNLYKNDPKELENRVKKNAVFKDKAFEFVYMDIANDHGA